MRAVVMVAALALGCGRFSFDPSSSPSDGATGDTRTGDGDGTPRVLYATSQSELFRIDPTTLARTSVMVLCTNVANVQLADIAMSSTGVFFASGLANTAFYRVEMSGMCTQVTNLPVRMFALEFVPPGVLGSTEVLLGGGDDGNLYRIDPVTGVTQLIGALGVVPGGDLTWTGSEALMTTQTTTADHLSRVNLTTGAATDLGDTTYDSVTGLAWFDGALYGFANAGTIFVIDPATGAPTRTQSTTEMWAGATTGE